MRGSTLKMMLPRGLESSRADPSARHERFRKTVGTTSHEYNPVSPIDRDHIVESVTVEVGAPGDVCVVVKGR
jgi:hypothetical protein